MDSCHTAGTCDSVSGACSNPAAVDGTSCDDGNACTTGDACSSGVCVGAGPAVPSEVDNAVAVTIDSGGTATVSWDAAPGSSSSTVIRGLVSHLPVGPGGDDEVCLENAASVTSMLDLDTPDPGDAFWYLVQGINSCGRGTFGYQSQNGVQTVERISATCP
jgi:hypothetical protein